VALADRYSNSVASILIPLRLQRLSARLAAHPQVIGSEGSGHFDITSKLPFKLHSKLIDTPPALIYNPATLTVETSKAARFSA